MIIVIITGTETFCVVVLLPEIDTAKPKDTSEKKSKPSKQQECIVCKKVLKQFIICHLVEGS